jgi:hypothetical protein
MENSPLPADFFKGLIRISFDGRGELNHIIEGL